MGDKWVFRIKGPDSEIERYKTRRRKGVHGGSGHQPPRDISPRREIYLYLDPLAAAKHDLERHQMDIKMASLNASSMRTSI